MVYDEKLIKITNKLCENDNMYSLILLEARSLCLTLSGYRCFLDGKYILCLNVEDTVSVHTGHYTAVNLSFQPYFYNVNLNHDMIGMEFYDEMREKYGYPDFRLFRMRNNDYFGIIRISDEEFSTANLYFSGAKRDIKSCEMDVMWSCRARSNIISVLHIAESAYLGKESGLVNEIVRYINDHVDRNITLNDLCLRFNTNRTTVSDIIKEKTGMPPMKYVLMVRLNKSKPDLLFTKLPINEIAEKYGFSDANYYIRAFRKHIGVSPLKFRKEGWEMRIRDESIYRNRAEEEKKDMTVKEFCDFYEKGLGRAIIRLKQQKDKEPYKKAFADICIHEKNGDRALDIYEKEILDIFDDVAFTKEIAEQLLEKLKGEKAYTAAIPLLILLGYRETVTEILENAYRDSYSRLLAYTKKPWDGEKYPPFAKTYMTVSCAMARYLKVGDRRIKKILFDIADLYDYCRYPVIPTYQNPLFQIWDGMGREYFFPVLDEVVSEHQNGSKLDIRKQIVGFSDDKREIPNVTISEILSHRELNRDTWYLTEGFYNGDEDLKKAVAKAAIEEKDIEKQLYLLHFFTIRLYAPENSPVEFPLDATPLVKMAEKEGFALPDEPPYGVTEPVLQILENTKCQAAHDLAMKFYYDNSITQRLRNYAISIRFGKNYISQMDKSDFVALMLSNNTAERDHAIEIFMDDIRHGVEDLPLDMIPHVFANLHSHWKRNDFCKVLAEKDLMPEKLKEECLCDCNKLTRELFLKTKKPEKTIYGVFLSAPETP